MDTPPRFVLGRYRLLHEIAAGGTARVFRARDEQLGRYVAVKLLHPHLLPDDTSRRRLEAEARAAAGLAHPSIAAVYDVDADPAAPALVMELVEGESLAQRLARDGRLPAAEVARLGAEVADALFLAHRRGIVHRDVKPGNILVERDRGRAKLIDFGIAHNLAPGAASLTQTGTALGTPRYMSPEQMAGEPAGPRTDLWSLGAVLYEAVSGRVPFDGAAPLAIARQQRDGAPPLPDDVDADLAAVIGACLAYRVEDRPLHAGAVAEALARWRPGARDATTVTRLVPVPLASTDLEDGPAVPAPGIAPPASPRRSRRPRFLAGLVAAAAVLLLAVTLAAGPLRSIADAPPTAPPTADPTPDWTDSLVAAHLEACGEPLEASELAGMAREEAEAWVGELVADCLDSDDDDEGEGGGNGDNGNGNGNGNNGNGNNGNGNGRGDD